MTSQKKTRAGVESVYSADEVRAFRESRCAKDFIIVCEPGKTPIIKCGSLFDPHGDIVMLQLLREYHPSPETRLIVATIPEGGDDLWVTSEHEALWAFRHSAGRKAKRHVKEQLAKERAASWHKPPAKPRARAALKTQGEEA